MIPRRGNLSAETAIKACIIETLYGLGLSYASDLKSDTLIKVVSKLMNHSMHDREVLVRNATRLVNLDIENNQFLCSINLEEIESFENSIEKDREERSKIETMLRLGATVSCMKALFGLDKRKVTKLRKQYSIEEKVNGGTSDETCDDVMYIWNQLLDTSDIPKSLIETSRQTGVPIGRIWNIIQNHNHEKNHEKMTGN